MLKRLRQALSPSWPSRCSRSSTANFFIDSGGANPDYLQLGSGGFVSYPAAAGGESFHIQAQGGPGAGVIDVGSVHRIAANDCHAQARGEVNP